jgi:hypothetical protein
VNESIRLPWPIHPEDLVISELLKSSREFQAFYQAERNKITGDVYWAHDQTMPEGIDYRSTRIVRAGKQIAQVIRLRQVPATIKDACKIAHELEHLVLDAEGFQCTHPLVPDTHPSFRALELLSSSLNSMLIDPLVDSRLQGYGFDLRGEYEREVEEDIRQLSRFTRPPPGRLERTRWVFNYVDKLLYWEMLDSSGEQSEFQLWFDSRFPHIASRGKKLLARVKRTGYDTPENQSRLFQDIIRRYKLDDVLDFP